MDIAVQAKNLSKRYKIYPDSWSRVVEWMTRGKVQRHSEKWALRDISFDLPRGSALGVLGSNGAGKSTLLKILTGTTLPSGGSYSIDGKVGSLLELGAGFHPEFSGKDNVFMNAAIMGLPKKEVRERFDELAEFADLGDYLHQPVRTYSSGMAMRLGFAVAMMSHPDVLILDEVLAVGDQAFQKKCMDRIREIRQSGSTILFVSHSTYHVRQICDRAIWIDDGGMIMSGDPTVVTDEYVNYQYAQSAGKAQLEAELTGQQTLATMPHLGDIKLFKAGEGEARTEFESNDLIDIHLEYRNPTREGTFYLAVIVNRNDDVHVFSSRSSDYGHAVNDDGGTLVLRVPLKLTAGEFYVSGYLLDETLEHVVDQRLSWCRFKVKHDGMEKGIYLADVEWLKPEEVV